MVTKKLLLASLTMVLFVAFYFIFVYQIVIDCFLPVVVCSVEVAVVGVSVKSKGVDHVSNMYIFSEVAVVGVSVKSKGDDHVSNIYIFQQKYRFQGLDGGDFLMVKQKFVTRKWNRCAVCLFLYFIFVYQLVRYFLYLSGFYFIFV